MNRDGDRIEGLMISLIKPTEATSVQNSDESGFGRSVVP